ncbi:MAG: hypothetical protein ACRCWR_07925 [Saezia sp.]
MLSKEQLAQVLLVKLRLRHPEYEFTLNTNHFQDSSLLQIHVSHHEQKIFSCSLDKLYNAYQNNPQDLDNLCAPLLSMVQEFLFSIQDEKAILLPLVVSQERLDEIQNAHQKDRFSPRNAEDGDILFIPFIDNLFVVFVLDGENRLRYLTAEHLKKLGNSQDIQTVYEQALNNLSLLLPELKIENSHLFEATLRLDENYELSMLLIFDQWKHRLPFNTSPAIAVAARDAIIFADSSKPEQIDALKKLISNMHDYGNSPLVNQLLTIENNIIKLLENNA